MALLLIKMFLGHLVGDFLCQPKWMAIRKSEEGHIGALICTVHVMIYTMCVMWITGYWGVGFFLAVAVPHWVVDRISWAAIHLKLMGGRSVDTMDANDPWDGPFTAIHYTFTDMTMHLLMLYILAKLVITGTLI